MELNEVGRQAIQQGIQKLKGVEGINGTNIKSRTDKFQLLSVTIFTRLLGPWLLLPASSGEWGEEK
jgi:hypothetical protein